MLGGTQQEWNDLVCRTVKGLAPPDKQELLQGIIRSSFFVPQPKDKKRKIKVDAEDLSKIAVEAAAGKDDSLEGVCKSNGISQRTFWRYFLPVAFPELQAQIRVIMHRIFQLAKRRFGLMLQFEVSIDETQTLFFGKARGTKKEHGREVWIVDPEDADLTEVGLLAGSTKHDKYAGKFRALTYQVMVRTGEVRVA